MRKIVLLVLVLTIIFPFVYAPGADTDVPEAPAEDVEIIPTEVVITEPTEIPTEVVKPWTDEEVKVLAQMLYGECRGVKSVTEQAACVWCVC